MKERERGRESPEFRMDSVGKEEMLRGGGERMNRESV